MECVLAIDQGTTGSRAVLYGLDGTRIASSYREFSQYFPKPGWVEHNPLEIWDSVVGCITDVMAEASGVSVACVGITNQRETTVVWDVVSGEPLHNAIVWQCRRTAERCTQLNRDASMQDSIRRITGLPVDAYFSATKLEWLMQNVAAVRNSAQRGRLRCGTVDSWLLWKLTGGKVHVTDYTNAARTMLFDIERVMWSDELLGVFKVPSSVMPEVRKSSGEFGIVDADCGLLRGVPITGMAGDQQSALFGQACFVPGSAKNTYGTGAFVLLNAGERRPVGDARLITTLGCGAKGQPVYVLEGAIFSAGATVQWLRDGLGLLDSAAASAQMAEAVPDNGGVYFVPAFVGLGAPYWDSQARGTITGITRGTTKNHLVRAALEATCYRTRDVIATMIENSGLDVGELKVDGGASANDFLCQFQSDILSARVVRPVDVETTARGAAYLAGLGSGFWPGVEALTGALAVDRVFIPQMSRQRSRRLYDEWSAAVQRVLADKTRA
ncbi:MAG: glycerol kinase GlpK [Dehalococcoidia bacterium]|nr:glycerol kinase GlpK [Dehalococcoidia bacterium]